MDKAEKYERETRTLSQQGFLRDQQIRARPQIDIDGHTTIKGILSSKQFRTWIEGYGLDWPMVPRTDEQGRPILVFLVDADPLARVRWISANVRDILGFHREELVGRPSSIGLYGGQNPLELEPELCALFRALKEGATTDIVSPETHLVHSNGRQIPVSLHAGYGKRNNAYYIQATILAPVETSSERADEAVDLDDEIEAHLTTHDYWRNLPNYMYRTSPGVPGTPESADIDRKLADLLRFVRDRHTPNDEF